MKQKTGMKTGSGRMSVSSAGSFTAMQMNVGATNNVRADMPRDFRSGRFAMGKGKAGKSDLKVTKPEPMQDSKSLFRYLDGKNLGYIDEPRTEQTLGTDKPVKAEEKIAPRNKKGSVI